MPDFLYNYYSFTVVIAAVSLFILFKNLVINNKLIIKIINFFAPTTFAIYLIHENPNIREFIWTKFAFVADKSFIEMICWIIAIPMGLFILFAIIDKIRLLIFKITGKLKISDKIESLKLIEKTEDILCQK